jgi:hypothetical protein
MATITVLKRNDLFPVGTSCGIWPAAAPKEDAPPAGPAAIASATVDAAGILTVTNAGIVDQTPYVAYALVGGQHRYLRVRTAAS